MSLELEWYWGRVHSPCPYHSTIAPNSFFHSSILLLFFLVRQPPVGQGLLIHEVSRSHTTTHQSQYVSSGRVISSSQRPLPDNTQHLQRTHIHASVGFETTISAGERPQTHALDRSATGTVHSSVTNVKSS